MASDVPQDNVGTTSTNGEFGTSEYGQRLDYAKPKYQDMWAFIAFYVHVVLVIILAAYFWSIVGDEDFSDGDSNSSGTPAPTSSFSTDDISITGIIIALIASVVMGVVFGLIWLQCIRAFPEQIIRVMLGVQIVMWGLVAIVGFATGNTMLVIIGILFCAIFALYSWCIWERIPFAGVCLSIASSITQKYHGTIYLSFASVVFAFIWYIIWGMAAWSYILSVDGETSQPVVFILLVSLYWGTQVSTNVSHTTTCGVAATWYFNAGVLDSPSKKAFKRTMTTSFGSVAFGSLLVAILQAIKAMVKSQRRGQLACIAICILGCIERLMRYFNKYAFAQVAIYGTSFIESGRRTWDLFMNRGWTAIINDDLTGIALVGGALFGFIVCGGVSAGISLIFYDDIQLHLMLGLIGGLLGYCVVVIILMVVASGVVAVFVCFAEDPAACKQNRPEEYQRLIGNNETFREAAMMVDGVQPQTGQTTGAVQQQQVYVQQQPQQVYVQQQQYGQPQQQYAQQPPQFAQQFAQQQAPPQYQQPR